jgi:hypothetical protein
VGPRADIDGCGEETNTFSLPGFEIQTFQYVVSQYTDYAIAAPKQDLDSNILASGYRV